MRLMRRFAVSAMRGRGLLGSAAGGCASQGRHAHRRGARRSRAEGSTARGFAARGLVALSAATLSLVAAVAAVAATSAVLTSGTEPALAAVSNSSGSTLASVIPSTAMPGSQVTFAVSCASAETAAATLVGRTLGLTEPIQMRASSAAGDFSVSVVLPGSIRPGTYHPRIDCSNGTSTTAKVLIPVFGLAGGTQPGALSGGTSTGLAAGGLVLIGVGAVTGGMALRRRRSRPSDWPDQAEDTGQSALSARFDYSDHSNFDHSNFGLSPRQRPSGLSVSSGRQPDSPALRGPGFTWHSLVLTRIRHNVR